MADLVAADLTYAGFDSNRNSHSTGYGYRRRGTIAFGDGSDSIPAGGIPITKGNMGCPNEITSLKVIESSLLGYKWQYDVSAEKLIVETGNNAAPVGTNAATVVPVTAGTAGDTFTNNAGVPESTGGQDLIVTGSVFTGTAPTAATRLFEDAVALTPAATTLEVEVEGW